MNIYVNIKTFPLWKLKNNQAYNFLDDIYISLLQERDICARLKNLKKYFKLIKDKKFTQPELCCDFKEADFIFKVPTENEIAKLIKEIEKCTKLMSQTLQICYFL